MERPGPRVAPRPGPDAAFAVQIAQLQSQIQQKDMLISQMERAIQNNQRVFADMKGRAENIAVHMAAILHEKHGDRTWIAPETLEHFGMLMERHEFGGFDFMTIGPDAIGPRRHKMVYMSHAEMQKTAQDEVAAARSSGVVPAATAVIEQSTEDPAQCPGPWHKSKNAPGATCKKCGLSYPRGE